MQSGRYLILILILVKKEKRNCYINWSQLYNFVTKDYGLTEIGMITKNVLDKFWTVLDMSKTCPKLLK